MIDVAQIERMSLVEQLQMMELLWQAISHPPERVSSPVWHGEILAERQANIRRGEGRFLRIDQVKKRLQKHKK
jgi:hypothetical protein